MHYVLRHRSETEKNPLLFRYLMPLGGGTTTSCKPRRSIYLTGSQYRCEAGVEYPGAGSNGAAATRLDICGPKNDIQDQAIYCGTGCQGSFDDCALTKQSSAVLFRHPCLKIVGAGDDCGPMVNGSCG
ncbi:MAG: hypothetical protein Q9166_005656 [cf. Caloplaca sp. 2 TL-2023]